MSKAQALVHGVANHDTPDDVRVPSDWGSLLVWAVGRFGGIIIATLLCAYGLQQVYRDMREDQARIITMMESRVVSDTKLADALHELSRTVDALQREASIAHKKP